MALTTKDVASLHFEHKGTGTPLVLIHGFPFSGRLWKGQMDALAENAHVLVPDLPGFGRSALMKGTSSIEQYARDCFGVLDTLEIMEPAVIGGLSMGGYIALGAARQFPLRVRGLILASTRAGADNADGKATRDKTIAQVKENGASAVTESMYPKLLSPTTYEDQPAVAAELKQIMSEVTADGIIAALTAMRDRPDSTDRLANLHMPVLIIHGKDDEVIPPSEAEAMAKGIPHSDLRLIEKSGHLPNLEQRDEFNRIVSKFLSKLPAPGVG